MKGDLLLKDGLDVSLECKPDMGLKKRGDDSNRLKLRTDSKARISFLLVP